MNDKNMTALVSVFVRCYHDKNSNIKIYHDPYVQKIIKKEEYENILNNMSDGIKFFNPKFKGTKEEAIKWIVNKQIGPSVLGRSAFNKRSLDIAIKLGCKQYLNYASGYDTSTINKKIKCFEIDKDDMIEDKIKRLDNIDTNNIEFIKTNFTSNTWFKNILNSSYDKNSISFNSLLGISYYLSKKEFNNMLKHIANNICLGSSILFDYQTDDLSKETTINELLAKEASEDMKSKYNYYEIEEILVNNNLKIYEYLNDKDITNEFFYDYNTLNPNNKIIAPTGVAYILAVKK